MATDPLKGFVQRLFHIVARPELEPLSDQQLMQRYVQQRDEFAFGMLARRHGAMVWTVCWRILGQCQDTEDAFQATFTVLIQRASSTRWRESLEDWLHQVAHHVATKLQVERGRRRSREERKARMRPERTENTGCWWELSEVLDRELRYLSKKYRQPLILCHMEGLTWQQAAERLGISLRCLERRLTAGREQLRQRLQKRGFEMSDLKLSTLLPPGIMCREVPSGLLSSVIEGAKLLSRSSSIVGSGITAKAALLAQQMVSAYVLKTKVLLASLLLTLAAVGGAVLSYSGFLQGGGKEGTARLFELAVQAPAKTKVQEKPPSRTDLYGDPLPEGAIARLGSMRFRHLGGDCRMVFAPDGKSLMIKSERDDSVRWWEMDSGKELRCLRLGATGGWFVFAPRRKFAAYVQKDKLQVWDLTSGKLLWQKEAHFGSTGSLAFAPDGKALATCNIGDGDTVGLRDTMSGKQLWQTPIRNNRAPHVYSPLAFAPDGKTLAVGNPGLVLLAVDGGKEIRRLPHQDKNGTPLLTLAFAPHGRKLAAADRQFQYCLWDLASGKQVWLSCDHLENGVKGSKSWSSSIPPEGIMMFAPNSKTLVTAGHDGRVRAWDADSGEINWDNLDDINCLTYAPDGKTVATGGRDGFVRVWNAVSGKLLRESKQNHNEINCLVFDKDGRTLALGTDNGVVRLWDAATGRQLSHLHGHDDAVRAAIYASGSKAVLTTAKDLLVQRWDAASGRQLAEIRVDAGNERSSKTHHHLTCSPDGKILAVYITAPGHRYMVQLWDTVSGCLLWQKEVQGYWSGHMAWAPDGKTLAMATPGVRIAGKMGVEKVCLWDTASGRQIWEAGLEKGNLIGGRQLAFAPDGRTLAVGPRGLELLNVTTGKSLRKFSHDDSWEDGMAFAPDGRILAVARFGYEVGLWEVASGQEIGRLRLRPDSQQRFNSLRELVLSPDGRTLAWGERGNNGLAWLGLWDLAANRTTRRFQVDTLGYGITELAFAPDGKTLVSGGANGTALIWDVASLTTSIRPATEKLTAGQWEALWDDLASDAKRADRAHWTLADAPAQAMPFLKNQLRPAQAADPALRRLVADLDAETYAERQAAMKGLRQLGSQAVPVLRQALAKNPSLEARRRMESLLAELDQPLPVLSAEELRSYRAVRVLEQVGSTEAQRILKMLAAGAPGALLTREAETALTRLSRRGAQQP